MHDFLPLRQAFWLLDYAVTSPSATCGVIAQICASANLRFGMCAGANWLSLLTLAAIEMEPGHEA